MLPRFTAALVLALAMSVSNLFAQATQPTTIPADQTSPRGALKLLAGAMESGDVAAVKGLLQADNPTEQKMADSMAEMAAAIAQLRQSAVTAFGKEGAMPLTGDSNTTAEDLARIDQAEEKIEGDTAILSINAPGAAPITLKQVDGKWVVPMSEMAQDVPAEQVDAMLASRVMQTKLITEAANEIKAGQHKTAEEAVQALQGKMMQAAMQQAHGAMGPATAPSPDAPTTQPGIEVDPGAGGSGQTVPPAAN